MDSLVNIPNGLVEHAKITKITSHALMLCMAQHQVVSYFLYSFSFKMFDLAVHIIDVHVQNLYRYK